MLKHPSDEFTSYTQQINKDIWKCPPIQTEKTSNQINSCLNKIDPTPISLTLPDEDKCFLPEDQVYFKYIIHHSDGSLFEDSHAFYPYFPKLTEKETGPCLGFRDAINTMETGKLSKFRFFREAALSWTLRDGMKLDENYLDVEIEILAIAYRKNETPTDAFLRSLRTKDRAVLFFKAGDFSKALYLFKTVEYNLVFLIPRLNSQQSIQSKELQASLHNNASQCLLNLGEPRMAIKELESFDAIASDYDLPQNLLEKAAYRRCLALTKTNQYEEAKRLLKTYMEKFPSTTLFSSLSSSISETEKNVEKKFKRLFCNLNSNSKTNPSPTPSQRFRNENTKFEPCNNTNSSNSNKVEPLDMNQSNVKAKKSTDFFSHQDHSKLLKSEAKSPIKKKLATERTSKDNKSTTRGESSALPGNVTPSFQPVNPTKSLERMSNEPSQILGAECHTQLSLQNEKNQTNDIPSFEYEDKDSNVPWVEVTSQRRKKKLKNSTSNDQIASNSSKTSFSPKTPKRVPSDSNPCIKKKFDTNYSSQAKKTNFDFKSSHTDSGNPESIRIDENDHRVNKISSLGPAVKDDGSPSKVSKTDSVIDSHSSQITFEDQAQWGKPGDCDADFENYVFQEPPEISNETNLHSEFKKKKEDIPSPPPLHEILALIDMQELDRVLHKLFNSKKLYSATSLVESISTHSQEIVYWSKIVFDQLESLLEGILKKLQNFSLVQYFDRTPTKENPNRAPTPIQFSNETSILNFIYSEMHIRFCLVDSFNLNLELTSSISFHSFFEEATDVHPYFHLVSLDTFHEGLCRIFPPYDAYRVESILKAIVHGLFVRPLIAFYEDPMEKEALILGYLKELCLLGKLEWYAKSKKCIFKPKIYVRGPEKLNPLYL